VSKQMLYRMFRIAKHIVQEYERKPENIGYDRLAIKSTSPE
jgi:hypothetical protein